MDESNKHSIKAASSQNIARPMDQLLSKWFHSYTSGKCWRAAYLLVLLLFEFLRPHHYFLWQFFYSIRDISIGGRCVCNGHAESCDITDPEDTYKLLCRCQHNTCGPQCERCCPGYVQKAWRQSKAYDPFFCERKRWYHETTLHCAIPYYGCSWHIACNCFGHSDECEYNPDVDRLGLSLDINGIYDGGGVCQNCRHNTQGINCHECKPRFYRPYDKPLNATDVCQRKSKCKSDVWMTNVYPPFFKSNITACNCDYHFSTGNCAEGSGQCECRPEFLPPYCDQCSFGYYGYPDCRPCDCHVNGTRDNVCEVGGGQCPCKRNYAGNNCDRCAEGFYNFPECIRNFTKKFFLFISRCISSHIFNWSVTIVLFSFLNSLQVRIPGCFERYMRLWKRTVSVRAQFRRKILWAMRARILQLSCLHM